MNYFEGNIPNRYIDRTHSMATSSLDLIPKPDITGRFKTRIRAVDNNVSTELIQNSLMVQILSFY